MVILKVHEKFLLLHLTCYVKKVICFLCDMLRISLLIVDRFILLYNKNKLH